MNTSQENNDLRGRTIKSRPVWCTNLDEPPPSRYESKQNARLDIFFFASDVAQTPVAVGDDASRRRCPSSTRIITLSVNPGSQLHW